MNKKEKAAYIRWNKEMTVQGNMLDTYFKQMQKLYEECGGGRPTCSFEGNLSYLLTSNNENIRNRALNIYRNYWQASGQYDALLQFGTALANVQ
jgi:hypothetical protein